MILNLSKQINCILIRPISWVFRPRSLTTNVINQSLYNFSEEEQMIKETGYLLIRVK